MKIEAKLRKALWKRGFRYRKNYSVLPRKSDIVFTQYRVAVFCDSEFFHGKDLDVLNYDWKNQKSVGIGLKKILKNIERDDEVNK